MWFSSFPPVNVFFNYSIIRNEPKKPQPFWLFCLLCGLHSLCLLTFSCQRGTEPQSFHGFHAMGFGRSKIISQLFHFQMPSYVSYRVIPNGFFFLKRILGLVWDHPWLTVQRTIQGVTEVNQPRDGPLHSGKGDGPRSVVSGAYLSRVTCTLM